MFLVVAPLSMALASAGGPGQAKQVVDQQLVVEFARKTVTAKPSGFVFDQAQATYGPSVLTADKLTVVTEPGQKHFAAEGHVHVLDIDGTLDADRVDYDWTTGSGSALNVHAMIQGFMVTAGRAKLNKHIGELDDIFATPCGNEKQMLIAITAPKAVVRPNGDVIISRPRLYLLDHHVLTLNEYVISPNRRTTSLPLPSVSYSKSSGFNGSWVPSIFVTPTLAANGSIRLGQHAIPSEDLLLSQSLLPLSKTEGSLVPYSDFAEHFGYSYFENVWVPDPGQEHYFVAARRQTLSFGTVWNEYPSARLESVAFNKPFEVVYEGAGSIGGMGAYTQLRGQKIEQIAGPSETRMEGFQALSLPRFDIVPHLYTDIRLDGFESIGNAKPYGWAHGQLGLVAKPSKEIRLGLAYTKGSNFGTPLFETDELYKNQSVNARADLVLGPRTFSILLKYDPVIRDWYDTEFEVSQAAGCLEPYAIYRAVPRGYVFGLRLRLDNLMEALQRRGAVKQGQLSDDR